MRLELNLSHDETELLLVTLRKTVDTALELTDPNTRNRGFKVRDLVDRIEQAVVEAEIVK